MRSRGFTGLAELTWLPKHERDDPWNGRRAEGLGANPRFVLPIASVGRSKRAAMRFFMQKGRKVTDKDSTFVWGFCRERDLLQGRGARVARNKSVTLRAAWQPESDSATPLETDERSRDIEKTAPTTLRCGCFTKCSSSSFWMHT